LTYSSGQEKDHLTQEFERHLNANISLATGAEKIVLCKFKEGLQHILYDINTYPGFSGAPVLNENLEARAIHVRESPEPFQALNQGLSFAAILDILECSI